MEKILNKEMNNASKDNSVFTMFYKDAKSNNNINAALVLSSFSYDKGVLTEAISLNHQKNYFRANYQKALQIVLISNYNEH